VAIGVVTTDLGHTDAGAARATRRHPCRKHTWCVLEDGHEPSSARLELLRAAAAADPKGDAPELVDLPGGCVATKPAEHPPADFGPTRAVRR
jgi:hypothetical protein